MIAIIGAGSWGTAVAIHLAHYGNPVLLWTHSSQHAEEMNANRCNHRYLPANAFPPSLTATADFKTGVTDCDTIIIAVPSHAFSSILDNFHTAPSEGIAWLTKGLDPNTHSLLNHLVEKKWGNEYPFTIISGPSFAAEVANLLPTALTIAGNSLVLQKKLQQFLHYGNLRVYLSNDYIGVQLCGAVKNVLAIACGISDGLNYGANAKAALITRGLAEMSRLGVALGARPETFLGLAGVGDLILTCTDNQSRNRRFGLLVGRNCSIMDAEHQIGQVVEGKSNASQVCRLALEFAVEMPICTQVHHLLEGRINAKDAVHNLMQRQMTDE